MGGRRPAISLFDPGAEYVHTAVDTYRLALQPLPVRGPPPLQTYIPRQCESYFGVIPAAPRLRQLRQLTPGVVVVPIERPRPGDGADLPIDIVDLRVPPPRSDQRWVLG
jgi:hypothetical protein